MPWPSHDMITMAKGNKAKAIRKLLQSILEPTSIKNSWKHFVVAAQSMDGILKDAAINSSTADATRYGFIIRY